MANDVYQLITVGVCAGEFFETVQHYESGVSGAPDPASGAQHLVDGFQANVEAALADCMASDTTINGYKAKRINNGGGPTYMLPIAAVPGTFGGTSATSGLAGVVVSRYPHAGKWKTGRWFLPGLAESAITGNAYAGSYITNVLALAAANASFVNTGTTFTFGVWLRKFSIFIAPTYVALSAKVGVQRRRLLPVL